MRRMVVLLSVVAVMVGMLAMSVAPAFAARPLYECVNPADGQVLRFYMGHNLKFYSQELGWNCTRIN